MQMFYYDDKISILEKQGNFKELLNYLEDQFPFSEQNFSTQIAYSWYLYSQGDFVNKQTSEDWEFYKGKWEEKLDFAINNYEKYQKICFMIAYTLEMNGMDIDDSLYYEFKIDKFYNLSRTSKDINFNILVDFILSNRKSKIKSNVLQELFPNDSLIDKYFLDVLS